MLLFYTLGIEWANVVAFQCFHLACITLHHTDIVPKSVVVYPGGNASFTCETQCPHVYWKLFPEIPYTDDPINSLQHKVNINDILNNTRVLCYCLRALVGESSIDVQGTYRTLYLCFSVQFVVQPTDRQTDTNHVPPSSTAGKIVSLTYCKSRPILLLQSSFFRRHRFIYLFKKRVLNAT